MNPVTIVILFYFVLQLCIGFYASRSIKSQTDYIIAGRNLGYPLAIFSIFATWFGSETCIGAAGQVYDEGLRIYSAEPFCYGVVLIVMGLVFAAPLWKRNLTTLADLFRQRYSVRVERLAAIIMIPSSMFWAAAQVRAFGQVLVSTSSFSLETGIALATLAVVIYTVFGGMKADCISDLVQGIVLIAGLVFMTVSVVWELGGPSGVAQSVDIERVQLFNFSGVTFWELAEQWSVPICGSVVAQELAARVISSRSPQVAKRSSLFAGGLYILVGLMPVFLGLVGVQWYEGLDDSEQILPMMAREHLPTILYALFAGALISAILSTIDSILLVASSLVAQNLVYSFKPDIADRTLLRISRLGVLFFGIVAFILALRAETIIDLLWDASSLGSAGVFTVMTFGLFSRRGGEISAIVALVTGIVVYGLNTYVFELSYAYLVTLAVTVAVYLLTSQIENAREPVAVEEA